MGAACSHPSRVAPLATPPLSLIILWDVENLPVPRLKEQREYGTAGDLGEALLAHCVQASGADTQTSTMARLVCVHPERYPIPLKNSLRTRGVTMLDAGSKRGAVDTHLKAYLNDTIVDTLLEAGGGSASSASLRRWVWLASGDADFAGDVRRARRCGFKVGIIHGAASSPDFFEHCDAHVRWDAVLAECERRAAGKRAAPGAASGAGAGEEAVGAGEEAGAEPASPSAARSASGSSGSPAGTALASPAPAQQQPGADAPLCRNFGSDKGCTKRNCRYRHVKP